MQTNKPAGQVSYSKNETSQCFYLGQDKNLSRKYKENEFLDNCKVLNSQETNSICSQNLDIDLECHDTLDTTTLEAELPPPQWKPKNSDFLVQIKEKQTIYLVNAYYLETHQPFITPLMRAILYDWMIEVTSEFAMKRESVYLAMHYVDRFLSIVPNIKKEEYQLLGVSALYLASKLDEIYQPKITDFVKAAANGYSTQTVKKMERIILHQLQWKTLPITPYNILNWLLNQWDSCLNFYFGSLWCNDPNDFQNMPIDEKKLEQQKFEERFITYKYSNNLSYIRFRDITQVLDAAYLDYNILKFSSRIIAGSLLYLMCSKSFKVSQYALFLHNSQNEEVYDEEIEYKLACYAQEFISVFLANTLEIVSLDEIYPAAAFLYQYIDIELTYELPVICKLQSKDRIESHYEEFLTYQTHNNKSLAFVQNKLKSARNR